MTIYSVYLIPNKPGVGPYVGCTKNLKTRMQQHSVSLNDVEILFQSEDIVAASLMEKEEWIRLTGRKWNSVLYHLILSDESCQAIGDAHRGVPKTEEHKKKNSEAHLGGIRSLDHCHSLSDARKKLPKKECPHCNKMVDPSNFLQHHGDNCGKLSPTKGVPKTEEHKKKNSEAQKRLPKKECPHCHKMFRPGTFVRWHGDKCKMNQEISTTEIVTQ